jgi:hypothetical protein
MQQVEFFTYLARCRPDLAVWAAPVDGTVKRKQARPSLAQDHRWCRHADYLQHTAQVADTTVTECSAGCAETCSGVASSSARGSAMKRISSHRRSDALHLEIIAVSSSEFGGAGHLHEHIDLMLHLFLLNCKGSSMV